VIQVVDRALEDFLRVRVPLEAHAVDVSFQAPDKTWGAALTRPTVNVFLWDVAKHAGFTKAGLEQRVNAAGEIERRLSNPVVDLGYLITAWATERRDEHELLGSVLACVLANDTLPDDFLPERLAGARCGLALASADRRVPGDFWSALDGRLKPGLQLQVALPVEVFVWQGTAVPAQEIDVRIRPVRKPTRRGGTPGAGEGGHTGAKHEGAGGAELTRRRRNGALVMEGRAPRRPEQTADG
jgi:hypothetical protein